MPFNNKFGGGGTMADFDSLLGQIKNDCAWETMPRDKVSALAKLCGPAEVDRLIRELDALDDADLAGDAGDIGDEYWRKRTAYSQALAETGEIAVDPLLRALESKNAQTRAYGARALGLIGTSKAYGPLIALLAVERDHLLRMDLIEAIGRLRDPRAIEILLPYLDPPEEQNRGWFIRLASNALGEIGREDVIEPLSKVLSHDRSSIARYGAAEGLRKIKHPSAVAALRVALNDEDSRVRELAAAPSR